MTGIMMRVIVVANRMPKPREMPMGIRNCACTDFSNSSGSRPKKVVSEVSITGLKRTTPEFNTASGTLIPSDFFWLMKSTSTRLSLTTTPTRAITPSMLGKVSSRPSSQCPHTAPMMPKGITDMTISGWT